MIAVLITLLICATQLGCAYIIAERWYAHRDRAMHGLVRHANEQIANVGTVVQEMTATAATKVNEYLVEARRELKEVKDKQARYDAEAQRRGWDRNPH